MLHLGIEQHKRQLTVGFLGTHDCFHGELVLCLRIPDFGGAMRAEHPEHARHGHWHTRPPDYDGLERPSYKELRLELRIPRRAGKGITSRMLAMPVMNWSTRSRPRPKPAWGTVP